MPRTMLNDEHWSKLIVIMLKDRVYNKSTHRNGKSVAGNTTKIHMAVDSYGLPIELYITGGEVHDSKAAPTLIDMLPSADYVIADRGYDSEALREQIRDKHAIPVIPRKKNSKVGNADIDWCLYKYRLLVENVLLASSSTGA